MGRWWRCSPRIASDLSGRSRLNDLLILTLRDEQIEVTYGRGLWCAVAGVAAITLAARLAGRHLPTGSASIPPASDLPGTAADAIPDGVGPAVDLPWRRPDDEPSPAAPLDLTVQPTAPFARPVDGRDRPS